MAYGVASFRGPNGLLTRLSEDYLNKRLMEFAEETARIIEAETEKRTPIGLGPTSGRLKRSIRARVIRTEKGRYRIVVSSLSRGRYPNKGTGVFGKRGQPIRAKKVSGMRFFWHKEGRWVRTHTVQGQPPQEFMGKGRDAGVRIARRRFGPLIERA